MKLTNSTHDGCAAGDLHQRSRRSSHACNSATQCRERASVHHQTDGRRYGQAAAAAGIAATTIAEHDHSTPRTRKEAVPVEVAGKLNVPSPATAATERSARMSNHSGEQRSRMQQGQALRKDASSKHTAQHSSLNGHTHIATTRTCDGKRSVEFDARGDRNGAGGRALLERERRRLACKVHRPGATKNEHAIGRTAADGC